MNKETAGNIVFAKGGVEYLIGLLVAFSRACFSTSHLFINLVSWKKHSLRLVEIELFVQFSPPFANTFSVSRNFNQIPRKKMKEIWQFKKTIVDSEPYYIDNLNIWEFEWKNTGETIQIQDPLYKQNYSFNVYEINSGNKTTRFSAGEFSNLIYGIYEPYKLAENDRKNILQKFFSKLNK
ncbi:hypothetical protein [Kaistella sp.]